jgi:hypothetical protein
VKHVSPLQYNTEMKKKMGAEKHGITPTELAKKLGLTISAVSKRWSGKFPGIPFSVSAELSAEQIKELSAGKSKGGRRKRGAPKRSPKPAGEMKAPAGKTHDEARAVLLTCSAVSLVSVILTGGGLIMFASWGGGLLGCMFALYLLSSILVARNRLKGDTSITALRTVLRMETGAAALHCFTFHELLPDFPPAWWWAQVVASVVLAAFAAHLSYQAVLKVRNYNAEVIQNQDNG